MSLERFLSQVVPVRQKLFRFAFRLLGNEEDAKDITQDALMKVWDMQEKMAELQNTEAWCMRITRNLALDKLKSRKYRRHDDLDHAGEIPENNQLNPYTVSEQNDVMSKVHATISSLPEKYRTILQLRDIDGHSYQEIAEILDLDMNEVKVNLHRARKAVREKLQNLQVYGI